eukprot:1882587-Amphidinium_carterae.1
MQADGLHEEWTWIDEFTHDPGAEDRDGLKTRMHCNRVILEADEIEVDLAMVAGRAKNNKKLKSSTTTTQLTVARLAATAATWHV